MKTRASFYSPKPLPNVAALTDRYERLILMVKALIFARDFAGVLKTSFEIGRAARALLKGKAQMRAEGLKIKMLRCPGWRARVISDLGGVRKLRLWQAAMERAMAQTHCGARPISRPEKSIPRLTPHIYTAQQAEKLRREHVRTCARAAAHPLIYKDSFRVDQDGLFRLPPAPRAPHIAGIPVGGAAGMRDYRYDARKITPLTGGFAPAMVWPLEFFIAERGAAAKAPAAKTKFGKTPGRRRGPVRRDYSDARRTVRGSRQRAAAKRRIWAPP